MVGTDRLSVVPAGQARMIPNIVKCPTEIIDNSDPEILVTTHSNNQLLRICINCLSSDLLGGASVDTSDRHEAQQDCERQEQARLHEAQEAARRAKRPGRRATANSTDTSPTDRCADPPAPRPDAANQPLEANLAAAQQARRLEVIPEAKQTFEATLKKRVANEDQIIAQLTLDERMELHNELYSAGIEHMGEAEQALGGNESRRHAARAAELFERALQLHPENWNAIWALGMARQVLEEHEEAYEAFNTAYMLAPNAVDVCRELANECIILGKGAEGVGIAERACALDPEDVGLVANLALAYLINHQITAAVDAIHDASRRNPDDPTTANLRVLIEAVAGHQVEAPTRWPP
jgi:Flp pilus assembly protein TadD